ncbi:hypothetical protein DDZ14_11225 [Maritimibacter sp. 55A14]|uniref:OmpA family protein n=1 Tax=Maritimibacter sp. 55A14 TaxID=2174844 RepID=UPI000D61B62D|nr:OmpA family protein [Maritimibacter sp. 55A14]PWE32291.1 hypothetical protein DDZ14_11225 [Maritimibacter sp. 55A14]
MKKTFLIGFVPFVLAALVSIGIGIYAVNRIETQSMRDVSLALRTAGHEWARVSADGLWLTVTGTAPDEARRFAALSVAGETVDADRVIDRTDVTPAEGLEPPRYSIEILRNGPGISLIGLVPGEENRQGILTALKGLNGAVEVTDMLDSADHGAPEGWDTAVGFAMTALDMLPSAKVSVSPKRVAVAAISGSPEDQRRLMTALSDAAPDGLDVSLDIAAPRPVITPFTLRFVMGGDGVRFDSCSADSAAARDAIIAAARNAGLQGRASCVIGLGVPSPRWGDAAVRAIAALAELGGGSLTFSDADISLVAPEGTPRDRFDDVAHALESALPEVFSLHAVLPEPPEKRETGANGGTDEFIATRSPEGLVQLRGRLNDAAFRDAVNSFAKARFGAQQIHDTTRIDPKLPDGWPMRVLAGLEALAQLRSGSLTVRPGHVGLRGVSTSPDTSARITQLFSERLGDSKRYDIAVRYEERLDPLANLPTADECVADIDAALRARQITFDPGKSTIDRDALAVVDRIAETLKACADVEMRLEIGGHTDSQGRETMNLALSQARAEAVLDALLERGVLTRNMTAQGYGEALPIADNGTEAGREANRRIEFKQVVLVEPGGAQDSEENAPDQADATEETGETGDGQD